MSSKTINHSARKPFTRFEDTKPLPPAMAAAWDRAKRGRGRPRIGQGAEKVLISMEKRLLLVTDALAKRKGLDRSKLIALAVREMLEREALEKRHQLAGAVIGSFKPEKHSAVRSRSRMKVPVGMAEPFRKSRRPE
jgi:hypothetical protein